MTKKANAMWGGVFDKPAHQLMAEINQSISFDQRLYKEDIEGSLAHVAMLAKQKIINKKDAKLIADGLRKIEGEIESGKFTFKAELEDIHMNIEARLTKIIGATAGRLHTARSRNDQVATDFKLYVRGAFDQIDLLLKDLQRELIVKAEKHINVVLPGFTHLQTAQPISLAHHLHAYVEMFGRDRSRMQDARERMNESPLGSAALAGTSFPIDRDFTSDALGFSKPTANSLDSVSDRDFALDLLSSAAICSIHLSRFAEEIIIWLTSGFRFIELSDAFTTGSSIMPQKKNPDAAELIRGKSGRIIGNLTSLLITMKALPLAYSKDMQEDKEPVFDAVDTLMISIKALSGMVEDMKINEANMRAAAAQGFSTATDLADFLVKDLNMPFRDAHHVTGRVVKLAQRKECRLDELDLEEMQKIEPKIGKEIFAVLSIDKSVASRKSYGGTSFVTVKKALKAAHKKYL
jgi:argininosuccinate lyase